MRRLASIISQRNTAHYPSYAIVYEWEDILMEKLGIPIRSDSKWWKKYYRWLDKIGLSALYHMFLPTKDLQLDFVMKATSQNICRNNKNTIPVIIDFWLKEENLPDFFDAYKHVPLMLLSNREVYDLLLSHDCPFPIEHWPLSFPDQYAFSRDNNYDKKYDFCLFGRPNPFFERMRDKYAAKHPDFNYLYTIGDNNNREYYTNKGEFVCRDTGRASYLEMIKQTRISCYSTPGIDEAKHETTLYNQVTPRVFEMLCNGCQVIGHYPDSADVMWYNLNEIIPNVNTYEEFESCIDSMLLLDADIDRIKLFMSRHYTSCRAELLKDILKKHKIVVG